VGAALVRSAERCLRSLAGIDQGLVVAVSGGPDSVALARAAAAGRWRRPPAPLVLAHLNHQLRGPESDGDEDFVAALHATLAAARVPDLQLRCGRLDVAGLARAQGRNLEDVARRERYRWLAEVARSCGAGWVATGHTAGDQAETVLHRLLRGTGLQGLRGIARQRALEPGVGLVRPLLHCTRGEVRAYLQALDQPFREDGSNRDLRFTRNRIRHELLPHLAEHYNPAVETVLARLADQAAEIHDEEEQHAGVLLQEAERPRAGRMLVLDRARLRESPRRLVRVVFRLLWQREGWPLGEMGHDAWERLAGLVFGENGGVDLPGDIHARPRDNVIQVNHDR
jgi:tRNA(Ile)-lysidine synthase